MDFQQPGLGISRPEGGRTFRRFEQGVGRIRREAGIEDVRVHDLRHTFASIGAGGGVGLPLIGGILGHRQASTTQRYAHLADTPLRAAADFIGAEIAASLESKRQRPIPKPLEQMLLLGESSGHSGLSPR
ncbi:MAG: tyrosine-type recombinase/integrase [Hyphomonadaceae bacterium]|nr:tyrosine-type recombinase/integrase [Hyphomonadaceae bacterium]